MRASTLADLARLVGVALLVGVTPRILDAQRVAPAVDLGASSIRFDDRSTISTTSANPTLRVESSSLTLLASATHSNVTSGGWSVQGAFALSRFVPVGGSFFVELVGTAGGSADHDETQTGQMVGQLRAHFIGAARGFWLGAGAGSAWDGVAPHRLAVVDGGVWVRSLNATLLAGLTPTSITDVDGTQVRFADASVGARWVGRRTELGATLAARIGQALPSIDASSRIWGSASAALWIAGPIAVVASAGSYPIDYTQGYAGGRFAAIGLRLARRPLLVSAESDRSVGELADSTPGGDRTPTLAVERPPIDGLRTIVVTVATAQVVEVSGDFTSWQPVRLTRRHDGRWVVDLSIVPGTHEIALRIDGGPWMVPPGLTPIRDEFGGVSGILVVEK